MEIDSCVIVYSLYLLRTIPKAAFVPARSHLLEMFADLYESLKGVQRRANACKCMQTYSHHTQTMNFIIANIVCVFIKFEHGSFIAYCLRAYFGLFVYFLWQVLSNRL